MFFHKLFGNSSGNNKKQKNNAPQSRQLHLESLENREMLAVTLGEFNMIRDHFSSWGLSDNMAVYNVIEVGGVDAVNNIDNFDRTAAGFQAAINKATQTAEEEDIIVVRMDSFETDAAILHTDIVSSGPLRIDIHSGNAWVWIVALDTSGNVEDIRRLLGKSDIIVSGGTVFNNMPCNVFDVTAAHSLIGMDTYLNDPVFSNFTGTGYTTVIIDSGITYALDEFYNDAWESRIIASYDFVNSHDGTPISEYAIDNAGHGTNVASIAAGSNAGIAQDASIIMLKGFAYNTADGIDRAFMDIANALQWVIDNASYYNITSVNMSLEDYGYYKTRGRYNPFFDPYCGILHDMGIIVTAATGNDGYSNAITTPAANPSVISVSSFNIGASTPIYDNRGPGLVDIFAPGNCTSFAAPVIAGAAVLAQQLAEEYLGCRLTVKEFRELIQETGDPIEDSTTGEWYKRINIYAMANAILDRAANIYGTSVIVENTNDSGAGSLRQAILDCPVDGTIMFAQSLAGQTITLGDELIIDKSLTIDASWLAITIDADGLSRVFTVSGYTTDVSLIGLTMTGGYTPDEGGGIYNSAALTIIDCTIIGNTSESFGGALYNNGTMTVISSVISENTSTSSEGGGIYNNGVLTVTDCKIEGNVAAYTSGGICNNGTLTMTSSVIVGNSSDAVGGILSYGAMTLTNSVVAGNAASIFGGIVNYFDTLTITNCTIAGNSAEYDEYGSGIATIGPVELYNTIVAKNAGADIDLISIYFFAGTAIGSHNLIGNGISSTILDVQSGSNVLVNNMVTNMVLTAITKTTQLNGYSSGYGGSMLTGSSQTGGILEDGVDGNIVGTMTSPVDPLFVNVPNTIDASTTGLNYDPLDWNLRLDKGSQAINAGNDALAINPDGSPILYDLAGNSRWIGVMVDIGAYEHNQTIMVTSTNDSGPGSLRQAIADIEVGGTIFFDLSLQGQTIILDGTELLIKKSLTIDTSGLNLTIDADGNSRVFMIVRSTIEVSLIGLTITGGNQGFGGGICNYGAVLTITDCTISGNTAFIGGGIINFLGTLTVTNSVISGNATYELGSEIGSGGGIVNTGILAITNSIITGNTAEYDGGGIFNQFGSMTVTNCTIAGNTAEYDGGGIVNTGILVITNSVIAGNVTGGNGGGIFNQYGSITVVNSTIAGNVAEFNGGGIHSYGTVELNNTIIAQNIGADVYVVGGTVTGSHNLIGNGTNSTFQDGINGNIVGTAMLPIDPLFMKIPAMIDASNTGENYDPLDWDLRLQSGSVAIDAGDDLLALNPDGSLIEFDRDGNLRFIGIVDIGAYEFQPLLV